MFVICFELETTDIRNLRCYCCLCSVSLAWLTLSLMYNICIAFNCCYLPLTFSPARAAVKNVSVCVCCVLFGVVDTSSVWVKRNDKDQLSEHAIQCTICSFIFGYVSSSAMLLSFIFVIRYCDRMYIKYSVYIYSTHAQLHTATIYKWRWRPPHKIYQDKLCKYILITLIIVKKQNVYIQLALPRSHFEYIKETFFNCPRSLFFFVSFTFFPSLSLSLFVSFWSFVVACQFSSAFCFVMICLGYKKWQFIVSFFA